jgi:signal transduction histidine kinase
VLLNLLLNSIEAIGANAANTAREAPGRIGIRMERAAAAGGGEGRILLTVYDTGPGVPEEIRARLFDPFYTTKAEGTGLGLSICQKIMEEQGGQIRCLPSAGGGAAFVLDLAPAVAENQKEEANREPEHPHRR